MRANPSSAGSTGFGAAGSANVGELDGEAAAHLHGVLAGRHELGRARGGLEGVHVRELPLSVVTVWGLAHRCSEDLPMPERPAGNLSTQFGMLVVALRIGLGLV